MTAVQSNTHADSKWVIMWAVPLWWDKHKTIWSRADEHWHVCTLTEEYAVVMESLCLLVSICTVLVNTTDPQYSFGHISEKQTAKTNNGKQVYSTAAFPPLSKCWTHFPHVSRGAAFNRVQFNRQLLKSSLGFSFYRVSFERGTYAELSRNVSLPRKKGNKSCLFI